MKCGFLFMIEYHNNLSLEPLFYINEEGLVCQEEFRDIIGYEGLYQVSDLGRLKSFKKKSCGLILSTKPYKNGYSSISLFKEGKRKCIFLHQLVAMVFLNHVPCGYKKVVDHVNSIKSNSSINNIRIVTTRENNLYCRKNKSGFNNISINENGKFRATVVFEKNKIELGVFEDVNCAKETIEKFFALAENKKDFSYLIKTKEKSSTGHKYIYEQKNKFFFKKREGKKVIRSISFLTINEAIQFGKEKGLI
jgi:hypothetical protein